MEHIRVSQFVARFFAEKGLRSAFVLSGGAALHLIHSLSEINEFECVPVNHEQTAAFAADGFARVSGGLGLAVATSGPGATNLITGIAGAFYDSVPVVFVTGQVSTTRMLKINGLRQYGFQETPFTDLVRPIVKGSFLVENPIDVRRVLEEATSMALSGRKGPVVVDIPDDVQRAEIDIDALATFTPRSDLKWEDPNSGPALEKLIAESSRPVVVLGAGAAEAAKSGQLDRFLGSLGAPVVQTWAASGFVAPNSTLNFGFFGTHGSRVANLVVQNSDLVISLGCRLDTKATGSPATVFARDAKKVIVEVDPAEVHKFESLGLRVDLIVNAKVEDFLSGEISFARTQSERTSAWLSHCNYIRSELAKENFSDLSELGPNPYELLSALVPYLREDDIVISDTGLSLPYTMESIAAQTGRRILHDFNNTAMGWSIGAAIGAVKAIPKTRPVIILGDGSLAMALSDLSTLVANSKQPKMLLFDNSGHGMIRQTQDQWFDSKYVASTTESGIAFPDWEQVCGSMRIEYVEFDLMKSPEVIARWIESDLPALLHVKLDRKWVVRPQAKFGYPNEDQDPPIDRNLFRKLMLVEPMLQSRQR